MLICVEHLLDSSRLAGKRGHHADLELLVVEHRPQRTDAEVLSHVVARLSCNAVPASTTATVNSYKAEPNLPRFATEVVIACLAVWSQVGKMLGQLGACQQFSFFLLETADRKQRIRSRERIG